MLNTLSQMLKDVSVVRRLGFAASFLPRSMPGYWETVCSFSVMHKQSRNAITPEQVQTLVDNLEMIDNQVFTPDQELIREIVVMPRSGQLDLPLGIVLVSPKENYHLCGTKLNIRADRASSVTVYDDRLGTLPATHFTRYCRKRGCSYQQHYGFLTQGNTSETIYDRDWYSLPYFVVSRNSLFPGHAPTIGHGSTHWSDQLQAKG